MDHYYPMPPDIESCPAYEGGEEQVCGICYDDSSTEFKKLSACQHTFCAECFKEFYQSMIEDQNKHHLLTCPQYGCEAKPTVEEIREIIDSHCFEKYERFQRNREVAINADLLFCSKPGCEAVLSTKDAKDKQITCPKCGSNTCTKCKNKAHKGKSCDQAMDGNLAQFTSVKGVSIHQCPKCKCQVEKDGGCPSMSCGICGHYWCWTCGFPQNHWFHMIQYGGVLCMFFNSFVFGFEMPIHFIWRLLLLILALILGPIIAYLFLIGGLFFTSVVLAADKRIGFFFFIVGRNMMRYGMILGVIAIILVSALIVVQVAIQLALCIVFGTALYVLLAIPLIISSIALSFRLLFQWCIKSKRARHQEPDIEFIEEQTKRMVKQHEDQVLSNKQYMITDLRNKEYGDKHQALLDKRPRWRKEMVHREHLILNASFDTGMAAEKTFFADEPFARRYVSKAKKSSPIATKEPELGREDEILGKSFDDGYLQIQQMQPIQQFQQQAPFPKDQGLRPEYEIHERYSDLSLTKSARRPMNPPNQYEQEYEYNYSQGMCDSEAPFRNRAYNSFAKEGRPIDHFVWHHWNFQNEIRWNQVHYQRTAKIALPRRLRRSKSQLVRVPREQLPMQKLEIYCQARSKQLGINNPIEDESMAPYHYRRRHRRMKR